MTTRDPWLHTTDVADELGLSAETIRLLIRRQRLPATVLLLGGRPVFRIRRSHLEAFKRAYTRDSLRDDWE